MAYGEHSAGVPDEPFGDEASYGDIWSKVDGPDEASGGDEAEALTEFAASPEVEVRSSSLRRRAQPPTPVFDVDGPEDDAFSDPDIAPPETADDVRSLLDKVMEEALPTNPQYELRNAGAFGEDGLPTLPPLPPDEDLAFGEAAAPTLPPSADEASDSGLRHLVDDLALDVAQTSVIDERRALGRRDSAPFDPLASLGPAPARPASIESPELSFTTPFPPGAPAHVVRTNDDGGLSPRLLIGLAVALIGLLLLLVLRSLF